MSNCEGCLCNGGCSLQQFGSVAIGGCPCVDCVIKVMCNEPCNMYRNYTAKTYGSHLGADIEFLKED
jgi:hypothetical protein